MEDKRNSKRVVMSLEIKWGRSEEYLRNGRITSMSLRGCFIQTKAMAIKGTTVLLNLWLPERKWYSLPGEVIYVMEKIGFGVRFNDLTDEDAALINTFIEKASELAR
jgi:Tfp pilus assembly protein PilZ